MNDRFFSLRGVGFAVLALFVLVLLAGPSFAASTPYSAPSIDQSQSPVCFAATFFQEVAGNRSKIIQLSIVFVLIGIALLFKK